MKIKEIFIDGYKNLYNTTVKFNEITSLIGLNNYGKTNFMEALENFQRLLMSNDVGFLFFGNFSYNSFQDENKIIIKVIYERTNLDELVYSVEFNKGLKIEDRTIEEELKIKVKGTTKYKTLFIRKGLEIKYRTDLDSDRLNQSTYLLENQNMELAIKKMLYVDGIKIREIFEEIIDFRIIHLILNQEIKIKETYLNTENSINIIDGTGFEKLLYTMKEKHNEDFRLLNNTFKKLIPSIAEIDVSKNSSNFSKKNKSNKLFNNNLEEEETYIVYVLEKNNRRVSSFSKISDGSKRIYILLLITIYFKASKQNAMILFEELENAIHPKLFEELIQVLKAINEDGQIVITSHSPYLVQHVGLENIYIGIPNKKGVAVFKNLDKRGITKVRNFALEEEISEGEFLFNLMCEDIEESNNFEDFFKEDKIWKKS